jgi:hypothetical protein
VPPSPASDVPMLTAAFVSDDYVRGETDQTSLIFQVQDLCCVWSGSAQGSGSTQLLAV